MKNSRSICGAIFLRLTMFLCASQIPAIVLVVMLAALASAATVANNKKPLDIDFHTLRQSAASLTGNAHTPVLREWEILLDNAHELSIGERLQAANRFFHANVTYVEDIDNWNKSDYWATPLETLTRGKGDCEDYAIGKYVSLLHLGIPNERLRLIYVRAKIGGASSPISRPHMVLAYYESPQSEPLILDSLTRDIHPASERPDLLPVFSFNSDGLWVGNQRSSAASPTQRLSRWRDVIERMNTEGITWNKD
ncbi:transglutaminase-like cysteine peptidase [Marinobacter halophilus]|nr:transglutaminase-like cysteine peptidase [Marinobacter halophilus]